MAVRAKVCGVMNPRDAAIVAATGADYMGVILSPGFSRSVAPERARGVYRAAQAAHGAAQAAHGVAQAASGVAQAATGAARVRRVGVFVDAEAGHVAALAREMGLDVVQLSGGESPARAAAVREAGSWDVWKTVHARSGFSILESVGPYADVADGILLDAWDPARPGGTGRTFAWDGIGREVREAIGSATFIAAGGMTPENAGAAVAALLPDVLDVSSGVESTHGAKDAGRVRAFVDAVRSASAGG